MEEKVCYLRAYVHLLNRVLGGETVVLLHGVPQSSFTYRKVVPLIAKEGMRVVSFDYPGMGLSEKPTADPISFHYLSGIIISLCYGA